MLLTWVPFARGVWAKPFLTVLAPSARTGRRHKTQADWMSQGLLQIRRWRPNRKIVFVGDAGYAVFALLSRLSRLAQPIAVVTRIRMDAALYTQPPERRPGQPAKKGQRLPKFKDFLELPLTDWIDCKVKYWYGEFGRTLQISTGAGLWAVGLAQVAFLAGALGAHQRPPSASSSPKRSSAPMCASTFQIVLWYVQRWQMEVTTPRREAPSVGGWLPTANCANISA